MPLARKASIVKMRDAVRGKMNKYSRRLSMGALKLPAPIDGDSCDIEDPALPLSADDVIRPDISPTHVISPRSPASPANFRFRYRKSSVLVSPNKPTSMWVTKDYSTFDGGANDR